MAQLLRTEQDQKTETRVCTTPRQSQELLQTFVSAAFGCLTFLRGIFPDDNYDEERFVGSAAPPTSSKDYVRIKRLKRGLSDQVDTFIDWIERGIFDALERKYLRAVLFAIYLDPRHPHDIAESYTFNIAYRDDAPAFVIVDKDGAPVLPGVPTDDARKNLQQMMRRFIMLTQTLPPLPDDRYLTIRLLFDDSCPADYQPPGFIDASEDRALQFSLQEDEVLDRQDAGVLNTGWHALSLKIACLPERQSAMSSSQGASQASQRKRVRVEKANDVAPLDPSLLSWMPPPAVPARANESTQQATSQEQTRQALHEMVETDTQTLASSQLPDDRAALAAKNAKRTAAATAAKAAKAARRARAAENAAKAHLRREERKLKERTALTSELRREERKLKEQTASDVNAMTPDHYAAAVEKLSLSETRTDKLGPRHGHRNVLGTHNSFVDGQARLNVVCECGREAEHESFDLVQCSRCSAWKHLFCYGYRSVRDPALTSTFWCCACRFARLTPESVEKIKTLALFRSAFKVFFDAQRRYRAGPLRSDYLADFCKDMGLQEADAAPIMRLLKSEGVLVSNQSRHRRSSGAGPTLVKSAAVKNKIHEKYFDSDENMLVVAERLHSVALAGSGSSDASGSDSTPDTSVSPVKVLKVKQPDTPTVADVRKRKISVVESPMNPR